jgi:hypothetical protein
LSREVPVASYSVEKDLDLKLNKLRVPLLKEGIRGIVWLLRQFKISDATNNS